MLKSDDEPMVTASLVALSGFIKNQHKLAADQVLSSADLLTQLMHLASPNRRVIQRESTKVLLLTATASQDATDGTQENLESLQCWAVASLRMLMGTIVEEVSMSGLVLILYGVGCRISVHDFTDQALVLIQWMQVNTLIHTMSSVPLLFCNPQPGDPLR